MSTQACKQWHRMFTTAMAAVLLVAAVAAFSPALATEGGGSAYPNGAEDFMSGAVPPPGNYFINYVDYYSARRFNNNSGDDIIPGFKLNVAAEVLRFIHVTDKKVLGGLWGVHLFLPLVYQDVTIPPGTPGFPPNGIDDSRASLGDIIIDPFILSWHGKNWHAATGLDIYIPTGNYSNKPRANIGRNYWTFEPIVAGTYLTDNGFEVSGKFMYDFNLENSDTDYRSGQEFHMDYAVGQKIGDVTFGMAGYFYQQTTDDEINGTEVPNNKGRVLALGPAVKFDYKNMSFSLKYLFETAAENRPEGNNLWFKYLYAF